jgi:hypothetical protein
VGWPRSDIWPSRVKLAVELLAHDMAVDARLWVVGHVRVPACVDEGVSADTGHHPDGEADDVSQLGEVIC